MGYQLADSQALQPANAGTAYRIIPPSDVRASLDVYVYDIAADVRLDDDPQHWANREGHKFGVALGIMRDRGRYATIAMAFEDDEPVVNAGRRVPGFSAAAAARSPQGLMTVELEYLYVLGNQFVKVRASVPASDFQTTRVPLFARELARVLDRQLAGLPN